MTTKEIDTGKKLAPDAEKVTLDQESADKAKSGGKVHGDPILEF